MAGQTLSSDGPVFIPTSFAQVLGLERDCLHLNAADSAHRVNESLYDKRQTDVILDALSNSVSGATWELCEKCQS